MITKKKKYENEVIQILFKKKHQQSAIPLYYSHTTHNYFPSYPNQKKFTTTLNFSVQNQKQKNQSRNKQAFKRSRKDYPNIIRGSIEGQAISHSTFIAPL